MYDEYYRMPDGKIFCEKCWRHGREVAEMRAIQGHNQRLQVQMYPSPMSYVYKPSCCSICESYLSLNFLRVLLMRLARAF